LRPRHGGAAQRPVASLTQPHLPVRDPWHDEKATPHADP
jgi:hypothetical protein